MTRSMSADRIEPVSAGKGVSYFIYWGASLGTR
jgi:hypothetical protein